MYEPDQQGKLPITNKEYLDLQRLIAVVDALNRVIDRLERRAKFAGNNTWRDLKCIKTLAERAFKNLFSTIPSKKAISIREELKRTTVRIEVEPPCRLPPKQHQEYTTVPADSLDWLVDRTIQWECTLCIKDSQQQKQCPFRQKLDSLYLFDLQDIKKGECPFQTMSRYQEDA